MDVAAYLDRIGYRGSLMPSASALRELHAAHLRTVPFENLSLHQAEPILLEEGALFGKIVLRRRGGFCYELNGLFAALLRRLGFRVEMLSAGVARDSGGFGPDFDHMALAVTLEERWLADVGFGDSFLEPLRLDAAGEQRQGGRAWRIEPDGGRRILSERGEGGGWKPCYRFGMQPRLLADYEEMCRWHQTSPESHFTRNRICSRATERGRITLSGRRLIVTEGARRNEREVRDAAEDAAILIEHFGIREPIAAPAHAGGDDPGLRARALLFDLDGVLVDSREVVAHVWRTWAAARGLDPEPILRAAHGRWFSDTVAEVAPGLDPKAEAAVLDDLERDETRGLEAMPGAAALAAALDPSSWAIVTSASPRIAGMRLRAAGIVPPPVMITSRDVARGKPAPDGYLLAASRLGLEAADCVVVEDAPAGVAAGKAAGMAVVAVLSTSSAEALSAADLIVGDLEGLAVVRRGDGLLDVRRKPGAARNGESPAGGRLPGGVA